MVPNNSILKTFYGFKSQESNRRNVSAELNAQFETLGCTATALVTVSTPIDKETGKKMTNTDGSLREVKSICLTLVSKTEKDAQGNPLTANSYLNLDSNSSLEANDIVDISSIEEITLHRIGSAETKVYDGKKIAE